MDNDPQGVVPEEPLTVQQPAESFSEQGPVVTDDQPKTNKLLNNKKLLGIIAAGLLIIILVVVAVVVANNQSRDAETSQYEIDNRLEEYRATANDLAGTATEVVDQTEQGLVELLNNPDISLEQRYKAANLLSGLYFNSEEYGYAASVLEDYSARAEGVIDDQQQLRIWGSLASIYRKQGDIATQKGYLELIDANRGKADSDFPVDMYKGWLDALVTMGY
jgi:hypothetical protein